MAADEKKNDESQQKNISARRRIPSKNWLIVLCAIAIICLFVAIFSILAQNSSPVSIKEWHAQKVHLQGYSWGGSIAYNFTIVNSGGMNVSVNVRCETLYVNGQKSWDEVTVHLNPNEERTVTTFVAYYIAPQPAVLSEPASYSCFIKSWYNLDSNS